MISSNELASSSIQGGWQRLALNHQSSVAKVMDAANGDPRLAALALAHTQRHGLRGDVDTIIFWANTFSWGSRLAELLASTSSDQGSTVDPKLMRKWRKALKTHDNGVSLAQVKLSSLSDEEFLVLQRLSNHRDSSAGSLPQSSALIEQSLLPKLGVTDAAGAEAMARQAGIWNADAFLQRHPAAKNDDAVKRLSQFVQFSGVQLTPNQAQVLVAWMKNAFSASEAARTLDGDLVGLKLTLHEVAQQFGWTLPQLRDEVSILLNRPNRQFVLAPEKWPKAAKTILGALQKTELIRSADLTENQMHVLAVWIYAGFNHSASRRLLAGTAAAVIGTLRRVAKKVYPNTDTTVVERLTRLKNWWMSLSTPPG